MCGVTNYPDAESGVARPFSREARCTNPDCYLVDLRVHVGMYEELGRTFFEDEDAAYCPHCGRKRRIGD